MAKIPVLEVFGPTIQGEGRVMAVKRCLCVQLVVIIVVVGATQHLPGMVVLRKISVYLRLKKSMKNYSK